MSACLNEARIQALADGEGTPVETAHAERCESCRTRVAEARAAVTQFAEELHTVRLPPMLGARVTDAVARAAENRVGATTLRALQARRPRWVYAGGIAVAAAVVLAFVFVLWPSIDSGGRLNAAEILNRSLQTLSVQGTELLRYELNIEAPAALAGDNGSFVIEQVIDHDTGRWRFARFAPDGTLMNGIAEDPAHGRREALATLDGQTYRFRFDIAPDDRVPLWDLQRRYAETMIRLVQASGAQVVTMEQAADGLRYLVDMPPTEPAHIAAPFVIEHARVAVDADDYHIVEFSAAGAIMGERVSIGYRLLTRDIRTEQLPASQFSFAPTHGNTIELTGDGSRELPRDFLMLLLREVARTRQ